MCLITVCPKGTKKNSKALEGFIKNGMDANTDGSGYAYKRNGEKSIHLNKGFRDESLMLKSIDDLNLKDSDELIIHHRIGTSGTKNDENMHPFVITNDHATLTSTKGEFNLPILAHNGVFSKFTDYRSPYNDTFHFVKEFMSTPEVLSLLYNNIDKFKDFFSDIIRTNKLAILSPEHDVIMIGNYVEDSGYYHSHNGYKKYVYDYGGSQSEDDDSPMQHGLFNNNHEVGFDIRTDDYLNKLLEARNKKKENLKNVKVGYKFTPKQIEITNYNFNHFFVYSKIEGTKIKKNSTFEIISLAGEALFPYVKPVGSTILVAESNLDEILKDCVFYVKSEFKHIYTGLSNLVEALEANNYSKSMKKKITKVLSTKYNHNSFTFKHYGTVFNRDLRMLLRLNYPEIESSLVES